MKIRIYSPYSPFPVQDGASQVIADQVRALHELGHEVELVTWKEEGARPSPAEGTTKTAWGTHTHWRSPEASRLTRVISSLFGPFASPELHYYAPSADRRHELGLADLGIYHYGFSYPWLRGQGRKAEQRQVVHFHNLEHELFRLRADAESNPAFRYVHDRNAKILLSHQKELGALVDDLWFLSSPDLTGFGTGSKAMRVLVPPTYDLKATRTPPAEHSSTYTLGFVGRLDFVPNADSARWIVEELCPLLSKGGFAGTVRIIGKNASPNLIEAARAFPFVRVEGFVEDLASFWSELDLMLVPHLSGSGSRIKLLDALARGVPALTNDAGKDRVPPEVRPDARLFTRETPEEWASFILGSQAEIRRLRHSPDAPPPAAGLEGRHVYARTLESGRFSTFQR